MLVSRIGMSGQLRAALWSGNMQVHGMVAVAVTSGDVNNNNGYETWTEVGFSLLTACRRLHVT